MKQKKITVTTDFMKDLALADFTTYHYKIWLILTGEPKTQAQMAEELKVKKQHLTKYTADLIRCGLIEVDRIEGRNKFLRAVTELKSKNIPNKDQMNLFD